MLFAAGFGTRMGALVADRPKPLIPVAGKALIDHALDVADAAGVTRRVMNLHYRGDQLAAHVAHRNVALSWEHGQILETGGGLKAALPLLGPGPVMILNTDAVWTGANPLQQLRAAWDGVRMDALLLLLPIDRAPHTDGHSDFILDEHNRIHWAKGAVGTRYVGAQIVNPAILHRFPERAFNFLGPWTHMIDAGRAYGVMHQGGWCDVGHPEGIAEAEAMLQDADRV